MAIDNYKSIAVLGDSIANGYFDEEGLGWVPRLSLLLNADQPNGFFFRNHAVSGDCIYDVRHRLYGMMDNVPDVLCFAVGVNDIQIYGDRNNSVAISQGVRCDIWREILAFAQKHVPNIFVFGILPVNESKIPARQNSEGSPQFYRNDCIQYYNQEIATYCAEYGVHFINFYDQFFQAGHADLLADDVHPNAKGHQLIAKWAYEALKGKL